MDNVKKDIIKAVDKVDDKVTLVDGNVNGNAISLATLATKQDNDRASIKRLEDTAATQKNWNRGLAVVEAGLGTLMVWLGVRDQ